jgi:hypothetical protein
MRSVRCGDGAAVRGVLSSRETAHGETDRPNLGPAHFSAGFAAADFSRWRQTSVKEQSVILRLRTNVPTCFVRFALLTLAVILAACGNDAGTTASIKSVMRGLLDLGDIGFYTQPPELAIPTNIPSELKAFVSSFSG